MKKSENHIEYDDNALIALIAVHDHNAFSNFYDKHFDEIYKHIYSKIKDSEVTKDLTHDIFLNFWEKRSQIKSIYNVKGYLYTSARNKVLDYIAHNKIIDQYYESFIQTYQISEDTDYLVLHKEIEALINKEIESLPEKMREVFLLSRREYLSYKEISEKLNISEKTVKTQINNSIKRLKSKLHPFVYFFLF